MRRLSILLLLLLPVCASAEPIDDAIAAYERADYPAALEQLLPLARAGNPVAQHRLGAMYEKGRGVPRDDSEAATWYRRAAEQGFAPAQFDLGGMYYQGRGVAQDFVRATMWVSLAVAAAAPEYAAPYQRFQDALQPLMSPQEIDEARAKARRCEDSKFKKCD